MQTFSAHDLSLHEVPTAACWSLCNANEDCTWFSIYPSRTGPICQLFETCTKIESNSYFVTNQLECGKYKPQLVLPLQIVFVSYYHYIYIVF